MQFRYYLTLEMAVNVQTLTSIATIATLVFFSDDNFVVKTHYRESLLLLNLLLSLK